MSETTYKYHNKKSINKNYNNYPTNAIVWLIIGLILFIPAAYISHKNNLSGFEARIFHDINNLPNSLRTLFLVTSDTLVYVAILICIIVPLLLKKYRLAWRFFFVIGGAGVVMEIIKRIIKEPRPIILLHGQLHARTVEKGFSFPSGHETVATVMALTLALILPRKWQFVVVLWILIVGFSRIYLGAHTPLDIIGGFALGLIAVNVVRLLPNKIAKKLRLDLETPLI